MKTTRWASRIVSRSLLIVLMLGASISRAQRSDNDGVAPLQLDVEKGICVVLGDPRCELAVRLANRGDLMIYVQVQDEESRQTACRAADAAGLYGTQIYVGCGDPERIGLADNCADAVVAASDATSVSEDEVLRVL